MFKQWINIASIQLTHDECVHYGIFEAAFIGRKVRVYNPPKDVSLVGLVFHPEDNESKIGFFYEVDNQLYCHYLFEIFSENEKTSNVIEFLDLVKEGVTDFDFILKVGKF